MKTKICGITRTEDARVCADLGVDFIGLVFAPASPRRLRTREAERLAQVIRLLGRGSTRIVGVFRDEDPAQVSFVAREIGLDFVQFHGQEPDAEIVAAGLPSIKAIHVGDAVPDTSPWPHADWFLFDTRDDRRGGGTGRSFHWPLLARKARLKASMRDAASGLAGGHRPFFLAGGLQPENVAEAIRIVEPDAVDVSSGVEDAPGIKSRAKIEAFLTRVALA